MSNVEIEGVPALVAEDNDAGPATPAEAEELSKKMRGTVLELDFALECIRRGYIPSMTYGDDAHYDVVVEKNGRFARVNLKKASEKAGGGGTHTVNISRKVPMDGKSVSIKYNEGELDLIVSKADDEWFFFDEVHAMPDSVSISHSSKTEKKHKWNSARDAWNKLAEKLGG